MTVPPPELRRSTTSSPRDALAAAMTAVTSSRSCSTCEACTSPSKRSVHARRAPNCAVEATAKVSASDSP